MSTQLLTRAFGSAKVTLRTPLASARTCGAITMAVQHRLFHNTRMTLDGDKTEVGTNAAGAAAAEGSDDVVEGGDEEQNSEAGVPTGKLPFRRRRFHQWLQTEGARFATPSFSGTNYIGDTPFPMNPLFKPTPPLSDHTKEEIYAYHMSDKTEWTPRKLGMKYNISMKRVEAILRLKHLEREMVADGFVPQQNFTRGMEQLMGVKQVRSEAIVEPLSDILPQVGSPKFEAINEDDTFTAEDAANVLKRRPLAEIKAKMLEEERNNPFKLVDSIKGVAKKVAPNTMPVSKNAAEGNARFKFAFVDTSKKTTLIREKDGTLLRV
ncbi:hypothetical protein BGZ94_002090, partial [Podila epigama]